MAQSARPRHRYTFAEYLAYERDSALKHEFCDGEIRATYPDASVVGGPLGLDPDDSSATTVTNPTLVVEVLSASTEQEDRGGKWQHYQLVPSLQEYTLDLAALYDALPP